MPYYDKDGRELSSRYDTSARGEWIYTEDGSAIRSEASRQREIDMAESHRRATRPSAVPDDGETLVLWLFGFLLFTLPLKALQVVLWCAGIGWRCGRGTYRGCDRGLRRRGVRPWLGACTAALAATVAFAAITVGLVGYIVAGIFAIATMDSGAVTLWLAPLVAFIVGRFLWNAWRAIRSP